MGLESVSYEVSEDAGVVEVCAVVYDALVAKANGTDIPCPVNFAFDVSFSTSISTSKGDEH